MSYTPNSNHNGQQLAPSCNAHCVQVCLDFGKSKQISVVANESKMVPFLF